MNDSKTSTPPKQHFGSRPGELDAYWMPFTANRAFKAKPRLFVSAEGMYYTAGDGHKVLDGTAGLWCVNAGHCRKPIVEAVQKQVATLDYSTAFQMGHPDEFELASRLVSLAPGDLAHVMFGNSGSEAVDTALKVAIAYQRLQGQATRTRLIGRERGYHGVGFGGMSVGGIGTNRKGFGPLLNGVDHICHTHNLEHNAFSKGEPKWGVHLADDLERVVTLHDASTIAAVIVEPVAGSTGVLIPPQGYLKRLREICDKHGILLIFDEVITGFGRLGTPFATDYFGVLPDIMTTAKGLTNGTVPMSAVFVRKAIYEAFLNSAPAGAIELFHGYTYSGHPLACAAALATLNVYRDEGLFDRAAGLADYWQQAAHSLDGGRNVIDVRNIGLVAAVELAARPGAVGARAMETFIRCFEKGLLVRPAGDVIAVSPPLIVERQQIDTIFGMLGEVIASVD